MSLPRVSIVIVTYRDRLIELRQAVDSCLAQEHVEVELIIATPRGDPAVEFGKSRDLRVVESPKAELFHQLNLALPFITGEWYACFSGNDVMLPSKSIHEITMCETHGGSVCYSNFYRTDRNLNVKEVVKCRPKYSFETHLRGNFVTDVSTMRRQVVDRHAPFREEFLNHAQYDFWLRVGEDRPGAFIHNSRPEFFYRVSSASVHIQRRRDKGLRVASRRLREKMLATHRRSVG